MSTSAKDKVIGWIIIAVIGFFALAIVASWISYATGQPGAVAFVPVGLIVALVLRGLSAAFRRR